MTKSFKKLSQAWDQASHRILETAVNGINKAAQAERNRKLSQFTTEELEAELLSRQTCYFGRLSCTEKAEDYLIQPNYQRHPACFNCKQDLLSLLKDQKHHA